MRKFAFFISIYLLVLALLPCGDAFAHEDSSSSKNKIEQTAAEHTDSCSSLCSCACCGQISYQETVPAFSFAMQTSFKEIAEHYQEKITQNFYGFVWQPPKSLNLI